MNASPKDILQKYWGYTQFRPLQEEVIASVLAGRDTLALMPTGGGKSICFQVPALARDGVCLVVSPLIALMNDQVTQLKRRGIPADAIHSAMSYRDIDRVLDNAVYGHTKLLYLSPERLQTDLARERIARMRVSLLAVDEAHCVSQWGYDFRPAYLNIADIRESLAKTPVLALTATATPPVVTDIQDKLGFPQPHVLARSFAREELHYAVLREEDKEGKLAEILHRVKGSAIVYVRSRRRTRETTRYLQRRKVSADYYHAGLDPRARDEKQKAWTHNRTRVMVCTNAFGMGIDKPDVRTVVHLELPDSLEAYFQEAGRAGRDGKRAYAVLLYHDIDRQRLEKMFALSYPDLPTIRNLYRALGSYFQLAVGGGQGQGFDFDLVEFARTFRYETLTAYHALRVLEKAGWIALSESVFTPATVQIRVGKAQLYAYQQRHPRLDKVVRTILRNYQGAFSQALAIREGKLANTLGMSRDELARCLRTLEKDGILFYHPQRDQPQLTFLRDRVDADHLDIDWKQYAFLKERQEERLGAALAYAETPVCRSVQLLRYFGEDNPSPCGQCDICRGRHREDLDREEYRRLRKKIRMVLRRERLPTHEVVNAFSPSWQQRVIRAIEELLDEGTLRLEEDQLIWKE